MDAQPFQIALASGKSAPLRGDVTAGRLRAVRFHSWAMRYPIVSIREHEFITLMKPRNGSDGKTFTGSMNGARPGLRILCCRPGCRFLGGRCQTKITRSREAMLATASSTRRSAPSSHQRSRWTPGTYSSDVATKRSPGERPDFPMRSLTAVKASGWCLSGQGHLARWSSLLRH